MATLVLSLSEADRIIKEGSSKGGMIHLCCTKGFEIILTLLAKVVAIHVRFFGISLQGPSLEWALSWL